jgi:hypothetical protein
VDVDQERMVGTLSPYISPFLLYSSVKGEVERVERLI